eukprot:GHVO01038220.1.p1 GENE.GHVO01038220.1~~GHVO01038220.1.p1  ORF type:complete len:110 (-),score=12.01 GHVO01038220.1:272-601(-)
MLIMRLILMKRRNRLKGDLTIGYCMASISPLMSAKHLPMLFKARAIVSIFWSIRGDAFQSSISGITSSANATDDIAIIAIIAIIASKINEYLIVDLTSKHEITSCMTIL